MDALLNKSLLFKNYVSILTSHMNMLIVVLISLLIFTALLYIDRKVKGNFSIVLKVLSLLFIGFLVGTFFLMYGQFIFQSFKVNIKSFTNLKTFFSSRIVVAVAILMLLTVIFIKMIMISISFGCEKHAPVSKTEKAVAIAAVFFDIAVIPNIFTTAIVSVIFACIALLVELGSLVLVRKLGFSFARVNLRKACC